MKVVVEKREIVGTLKTNLGVFNLLDTNPKKINIGYLSGTTLFHVVDGEEFENYLYVNGEFIVWYFLVPEVVEVKRVLSEQEEAEYKEPILTSDNVE